MYKLTYRKGKLQKKFCIHVNILCLKGTHYFVTQGHSWRHSGTFQYFFQMTITVPRMLLYSAHVSLWRKARAVGELYFKS